MRRLLLVLIALFGITSSAVAQVAAVAPVAPADPNRWEPEIQKFEAEDKARGLVKGGVVFIGASSIARWTNLAESFPDQKVVNRGFGGSEMAHAVQYVGRAVLPHAPRVVVLYSGENDLNRGVTPETVFASYKKFYDTVHGALPNTRLVVVSLKPSLLRWKLRNEMHATNKMIRTHCAAAANCVYVDVWPPMLGQDGTPKPELFVEDGLHMTPAGYTIWTAVIAPHLK
jgi:lysophospholipase L1-like esterase